MSDEVVHGLSAESKRIPSKWNRQTVADGSWLQKYTLNPLSARDVYLAEQIDKGTSALSAAISAEVVRATSAESALQSQIDTLEAATDVIMVYGTYSDFSSTSGALWENPGYLTENDVIKVLIDNSTTNSSNQTYYQATQVDHDTSSCTWTKIGALDPYYNKTEIDEYFEAFSGSISSNYYASGNIIADGNLSATHVNSHNEPPKIKIVTKDDVTFNSVIASSLSSQSVTAINLSSNNISATTLSASTAYGQSAKFDNISATHLSALTAQGNSAKFENINASNITANNISSTNLTALTASGNQASYTNISATTLSGSTTSINVNDLINAATAGAVAYSGKNGIQINDHDIMLSAKMSAVGNGITNNSAISLSSFKLSADTGIKFNATTDTLGISVSSSIINSAEAGASASAYITANSGKFLNSAHNAFSKVKVTFYKDASQGQHFNDVFDANNSSAEFKFKLGDDLFGERDSSDTFIITTNNTAITADAMPKTRASAFIYSSASYTAAGNGITNPYTGYLSALYLSAGNGITFDTTNNKLGILVNSALINSAKNGQSAYNWISANTDGNSAKWAKSATSASTAYNAQTLGGVSSTNIIGSAQYGQQAYNWASSAKWSAYQNTGASASGYLYNGLNVSAGKGIILSGSNTTKINIGIDYTTSSVGGTPYITKIDNILLSAGSNYTSGRGIGISGTNNEIYVKDEFVPWSASEINLPNTSNTALNTAFSHGLNNTANSASFAQGLENSANTYSIAQGKYNKAYNCAQAFGDNNIIVGGMAIGQNNKTSADVSFVIGNGTDNEHRSDLFLISGNGDIHMAGKSIEMSYGNSTTTISLTGVSRDNMGTSLEVNWSDLVGKNFVYASTNASGSILSANNKVTLVVTSTLPTQIPSGHYFIV